MQRLPARVGAAMTVLALPLATVPVAGQGSSVYVQSSCVSARAGAAVAAPCRDASSVYYNPAALAVMPSAVSAGLSGIVVGGDFTFDRTGRTVERETAVPLVPQAYASLRHGRRLAFGFGAWAPYGLGIEWPETFEGRYVSWKSSLRALYLQPTVAYQLVPDVLSVGAGVDVVLGSVELNQFLDAPLLNPQLALFGVPLGTDVGRARLSGSGTGYTGHVGAYYTPGDRFALGARYLHAARIPFDGQATFEPIDPGLILQVPDPETGDVSPVPLATLLAPQFEPGGPLSTQDLTTELTMPPQLVVGGRATVAAGFDLVADYQWTGWSTFDRLVARLERAPDRTLVLGYEDTHTFRVGGEYDAGDGLRLRGGWIYNTEASPDEAVTPVLPEAERNLVTAGFGYRAGRFEIDGYYNWIDQADRRGRVRDELPGVTDPLDLNTGVYSSTGHIIGITLTYLPGGAP